MFALNFENVANSEGISIQDLIPGTTAGLKAGNATTGDEIQVYDPLSGGYKKFYLQYVTFPPAAMVNNYKWMDGSSPAPYKFKNGDAFWYRSQGSEDVTVSFSGGVSLTESQTVKRRATGSRRSAQDLWNCSFAVCSLFARQSSQKSKRKNLPFHFTEKKTICQALLKNKKFFLKNFKKVIDI